MVLNAVLNTLSVLLWFAVGSGCLSLSTTAAVAAHDKEINCVALSPNDALVATSSQDRTVKVWNLPHLTPGMTLRGHKRGVWSVVFSPVDQVRGWGLGGSVRLGARGGGGEGGGG